MIVTTSANYSLFVDGVAWLPTTTEGESDVYIVASGGRFVFYDERGNVMFAFYNQYTGDFSIIGAVHLYQQTVGGNVLGVETATRTYAQANSLFENTAGFMVVLQGNYTNTPAAALEPTTNNGQITSFTVEPEKLTIVVKEGNMENYTQILLGNVLIAFAVGRD